MTAPTVHELRQLEELAPLRADWRELLARTPGGSYFQSLDWLESLCSHYGSERQLRVLLVEQDRGLVGILPLMIQRERRAVGTVRLLAYPLDGWGTTCGPLGEEPGPVLAAGLSHLARHRRGWDMLSLRGVLDQPSITAEYQAAFRAAKLGHLVRHRCQAAWVDLDGDFEDYRRRYWSPKFQRGLRRCLRQLETLGRLQHLRYRPARSAAPAAASTLGPAAEYASEDPYAACEAVCRDSWQASAESGRSFVDPQMRPLLQAVHRRAVERDGVIVDLLTLNQQPIAFAYQYHASGRIFGLRSGYDPRFARYSPGNLLYARSIESAFQEGASLYDLGADFLAAKRHFLTRTVDLLEFNHFRAAAPVAQLVRLRMLSRNWWPGRPDHSSAS